MWLIFSLLAACCFGARGILYQWTSRKPADQNLMLFGVFVMGAASSLLLSILLRQQWTAGVLLGGLMGVWSFFGNGSMYKGYSVGKASLIAILTGLPPVLVVIIAFALWGETLTIWQSAAFFVILIGVLLIRYSGDLSIKDLRGIKWGLLAMLAFSFNDVTSKQTTRLEADLFPTLVCMFTVGAILFGTVWLMKRRAAKGNLLAHENKSPDNKTPQWSAKRTFSWGMVVGLTNLLGMFFIMQAFSVGITGLVSAVAALNVLFVVFYARFVLKDRFNYREISGIAMAIGGIIILHLANV